MKRPYYEIARDTLRIYHEDRIIPYSDIINGIKKYISNYSDLYEITGELLLTDNEPILATKDLDYHYYSLDDMYIIPVNVILQFWEKYATPDEICNDVIKWYFEKYQTGYNIIFK
jgi:hypothetical protein